MSIAEFANFAYDCCLGLSCGLGLGLGCLFWWFALKDLAT